MALDDNNYENIPIWDGEDSEVAVAVKGSTFQEGIGPAEEPFTVCGWVNEDGIEESTDQSADSFRAWQGNKVVKRKITESETTYTVGLLENNWIVLDLKSRGATTEVSGEGAAAYAKTVRSRDTATDERLWRIRYISDSGYEEVHQFVGTHSLSGSITRNATELSATEIEVTPIGDVTQYTNAPAILAGAAN